MNPEMTYIQESNAIKRIIDILSIERISDLFKIAKRFSPIKDVISRLFPDLKSILSIDVKNQKSAEYVIDKICNMANKKFKINIDVELVKKIFYKVYGIIIKGLIVTNIFLLFTTAWPYGISMILKIAIVLSLIMVHNFMSYDTSLVDQLNNLKKSFLEFINRNIPTRAERNLAIVPLILYILCIKIIVPFLEHWYVGGLSLINVPAVSITLFFCASALYYICDVLDDWIMRKGQKSAL